MSGGLVYHKALASRWEAQRGGARRRACAGSNGAATAISVRVWVAVRTCGWRSGPIRGSAARRGHATPIRRAGDPWGRSSRRASAGSHACARWGAIPTVSAGASAGQAIAGPRLQAGAGPVRGRGCRRQRLVNGCAGARESPVLEIVIVVLLGVLDVLGRHDKLQHTTPSTAHARQRPRERPGSQRAARA